VKAVALLGAYLMIGSGACLITLGCTESRPNLQYVRAAVDPLSWIERYAALVALSAHNAYENERS